MRPHTLDIVRPLPRMAKVSRPGLILRDSRIDRKGIFASRDYPKGARVCTLDGKQLTISEIEDVYRGGQKRISADGYQTSEKSYLFLDAFSVSINHSCNPTCGVILRSTLIALRDIRAGDEITYDYSTVEWTPKEYRAYDVNEWPMVCRCGERNCRKLITCFPYLPPSIKKRYISLNLLPDHIKSKLNFPKALKRCSVCENAIRKYELRKKHGRK